MAYQKPARATFSLLLTSIYRHPERSEGSPAQGYEILNEVKNDKELMSVPKYILADRYERIAEHFQCKCITGTMTSLSILLFSSRLK